MTGVDVVPQYRTQVQCASPALSAEQLRVPAAFSLPPPGFIPKEDTHTRPEWLSTLILLFHSLRGFFFFPLVFCPSSVFILFLCSEATPASASAARFWAARHRPFLSQHSQSCDVLSKTCTFLRCVPV